MSKGKKKHKPTGALRRPPVVPKRESVKQTLFKGDYFKRYKWAMLILTVVSFALYYQSTSFGYVLDDKIVFTENKYVSEGLSGIGKILSTESFSGYFGEQRDLLVGGRYRPLSIVTFAIENHFFGNKPFVGHFINILIYILSVLLLMRVLAILFPLKKENNWYWSIPFIGALLFTLHPLHVEVVANIKGRDEMLTMMGAFGALYFTLRYVDKPAIKWLIMSSLSLFLGLLSKENAITFLAVIPATVYFFTKTPTKTNLKSVLPLLLVTVLYLFIRYNVIGFFLSTGNEITNLMNNPFVGMDFGERTATIMYTLGYYLKLLFIPYPLTHDYYPYHIPIMNWSHAGSLIPLLLYIFLAGVGVYGWKKKWIPSYIVFFYLATISIVSNIVFPVGTFMNERFIFISSVAFCLFVSWGLVAKLPQWTKHTFKELPIVSMLILLPFLVGFTWITIDRVPVWENGFELNKAAVKVSKNSARANLFMGTAYFNKFRDEEDPNQKRMYLDSAAPYINRALEIHPNYGDGLHMKGGIAAEYYRINGNLEALLQVFHEIGMQRVNNPFFLEYMEYLTTHPVHQKRMDKFFIDLAYHYYHKQENAQDKAFYLINKALEFNPNSAWFHMAAAKIFEHSGSQQKANEHLNQARAIDPTVQLN